MNKLMDDMMEGQEAGSRKPEAGKSPEPPFANGENQGNVVFMRLEDIQPHPKRDMYNMEIDPEFLESVRQYGVKTPLIIVEGSIFNPPINGYVTISGHRRHKAAEMAGKEAVPVIIDNDIKDEDTAFAIFVICNMGREKNNQERIAEYYAYKQILSQIKQVKDGINIYEDDTFQKEYLLRYLTRVKSGEEKDGHVRWRDIIKEATGFSAYEQQMMNQLSDEHCGKTLNRIRGYVKLSPEEEKEILNKWVDVRKRFGSGKLTLYAAVKEIEDYINGLLERYKPKKKVRKVEAGSREPEGEEFEPSKALRNEMMVASLSFYPVSNVGDYEFGYIYNKTSPEYPVGPAFRNKKVVFRFEITELVKLMNY